jgi:hypothetical protein
MTGDVGPNTGANVVNKITAASAVDINQPAFTWRSGAGAPTLSQVAPGSAVATTDFNITPQPAFSTANAPGSLNVNLQNTGVASEGHFRVKYGSTTLLSVDTGASGFTTWPTLSLGSNTTTSLQSQGGNLQVNSAGYIQLNPGGTANAYINANGNIGLFGTSSYGGGVKVLNLGNATTIPTSNAVGGGILYSSGGALFWRGSSGTVTQLAAP